MSSAQHNSPGAWAKRFHLASRASMERILRPYDVGSTQWYVMYQLAHHGPTPQREFLAILRVEKPTLSDIVRALVRKELIDQMPDPKDQRQRLLSLTEAGKRLWDSLPDPIALGREIAFAGVDQATLNMVASVLKSATEKLNHHEETET